MIKKEEKTDNKLSKTLLNDKKPKNCIEIPETRGRFNSTFDITWISEKIHAFDERTA